MRCRPTSRRAVANVGTRLQASIHLRRPCVANPHIRLQEPVAFVLQYPHHRRMAVPSADGAVNERRNSTITPVIIVMTSCQSGPKMQVVSNVMSWRWKVSGGEVPGRRLLACCGSLRLQLDCAVALLGPFDWQQQFFLNRHACTRCQRSGSGLGQTWP